MSGILSAIEAAGQAFAGYGSVTLGPVKLTGMAAPPNIPIGGRQAMTVHKLPGGARVIDATGQDDADIKWSGVLDTQDASTIARTLDKLRRSGSAVTLAWDVFSYQVVVSEFTCGTKFVPPMHYSIKMMVVKDNTLASGVTPIALALQVGEDLKTGNYFGALSAAGQGVVGTSVSGALSAISGPASSILGSANYQTAVNAITSASGAVQNAITQANGVLGPLGTTIGALSAAAPAALDTVGLAGKFGNAISAAGDLAGLSACAGYVSRAAQNLAGASA
jgi:hypothetical protein